ncbi:LysR family transcriptional regulator [Duganella sp. LjRoot269]|jgi:DNA-binding transcriptional LysR family regulator|uniref:LysR family transcriptional regulator n=1 Tax=Duganella sp. LjRoot269 TaxID=3342305 RepID=UPI003ED062E8
MQLVWLEDFIELAHTRSFARAAENRFITHPAFGRRIRALETWVGAPLLQRSQPVSLTPAGTQFLETCNYVIGALHTSRAQLQENLSSSGQVLRIATGRTLSTTFFPGWYESLAHRLGAFSVHLTTSGSQEAIARLANGDVELLLTYSSPLTRLLIDPKRFEAQPLASEVLLPVSAPGVRGRLRHPISFNPAAPTPWLAFASTLTLRGILANHLAKLDKMPALHSIYQSDSYDSILEMARRGMGLAWLPERLVSEDVRQGRLLVAGDSKLRVNFEISLYRLRTESNEQVRRIWDDLSAGDSQTTASVHKTG